LLRNIAMKNILDIFKNNALSFIAALVALLAVLTVYIYRWIISSNSEWPWAPR